MMNFLDNSGIGEQFTLIILGLFVVAMVGGAAIVGAAAMDSVNDTEPVGDNNITNTSPTTNTTVAWVDETVTSDNNTRVNLYAKNGSKIWTKTIHSPDGVTPDSDGGGQPNSTADAKHIYVVVNYNGNKFFENSTIYTLNRSTGNIVNETTKSEFITSIRVDKSGDLRYNQHEERTYSLSKNTRYEILDSGSIEVYNTTGTTGNGTLEKTINASSYEPNPGSDGFNSVLTATDNYVVVIVDEEGGFTNHGNIHIVNRETGESAYNISTVDSGDTFPNRYDNASRIVATPDGEIKLDVSCQATSSGEHYWVRYDYENGSLVEEQSETVDNCGYEESSIDVDFFRNGFAEDVEFVPLGELTLSVTDGNQNTLNSTATVEVYKDGRQIFERSNINSTDIQSNYSIDTYGGNYDVRVESAGYESTIYDAAIDQQAETIALDYSMEYVGTGAVNITSVTDGNNTELENWSVRVIDSNGETVRSVNNTTAPEEFELNAQNSYTVEVSKSGYPTTQQTVSISENTTTQVDFTLADETTETTTDDGDDVGVIVPGGGGDGGTTDVLAVVFGVGGIGFLIFLLVAVVAFRSGQQQFALILVMLVLSMTVAPPMFVGDVTAQTTESGPPDEVADLLVFTAFEDRNGQPIKDTVYAVDPATNETAWVTELNHSNTTEPESAIAVASDETAHRIYALTIGDNDSVRAYSLESSSGDIVESHKLNLTSNQIGRFAEADNSNLYFNTPDETFRFDFESDSLTEMYTYESVPVQAYSMGIQGGELQQAAYAPNLEATFVYEGTNRTDDFSGPVSRIDHTTQGYVYQTSGDSYLEFRTDGQTTWSYVESESLLRAAASDGNQVYATVGDELRQYGTTANSDETVLYTANPSDKTSHRLSTLEYDSGHLHQFQTRQGTAENLTSDRPTLVYRLYDPSTGDLVYETKIAHDSNYHRSVAVVHDTDRISAIVGGSEPANSLGDILDEYLPTEYILAGLGILFVAFVGILLLIWKVAKMPVRVILAPVRFVIWLTKLLMP